METLKNIHNRIESDVNLAVIVAPKTAIENELGKPFEKIVQQFYEWRVLNATRDNGAPLPKPDIALYFMSTELSDTIFVEPTGAVLEQINILNKTEAVGIDLRSDEPLKITTIIYYKNDTKKVTNFKMPSNHLNFTISTKNVSKIQLLKQNQEDVKVLVKTKVYQVPIKREGIKSEPISVTPYESTFGFLPGIPYDADGSGTSVWYSISLTAGQNVYASLHQNDHLYTFDGSYSDFNLRFLDGEYNELLVLDAADPYTDELWHVIDTDQYYVILDANDYMGFYEYWFGIY